jgi:4-oxalmesaconate hydratase
MQTPGVRFRDRLRKLYFDTVLYSRDAIELLVKVVGPSQCLYGAEMPGVGSAIDPETGKAFDEIIPYIKEMSFVSEAERQAILGGNAAKLFGIN